MQKRLRLIAALGTFFLIRAPAGALAQRQSAFLTGSGGGPGEQFGISVALSGDVAVIGADYADDLGTDSGAAYVFRRMTDGEWIQEARLLASHGAAGDHFGYAVAVDGDTIVVGAYDEGTNDEGAAYVFTFDETWTQSSRLLSPSPAADESFGHAVTINGNFAFGSGNARIKVASGVVVSFD